MAIESMTGFARHELAVENSGRLVCEIRSVNGKSLDVRIRLPSGMDRLELPARQLAQACMGRGNLQIGVTLEAVSSASGFRINEAMIASILELSAKLEVVYAFQGRQSRRF